MANLAKEYNLALALQPSNNLAWLPPEESASASHISRPRTPTTDGGGELALASGLPRLPPDEHAARLHRTGSSPTTPTNESDEDHIVQALNMSKLPAENQVGELCRQRKSRTDGLASLLTKMSLVEDDVRGAVNGLLASGLSDDDDYSLALTLAQHGATLLERNENSGMLAELEEGINSLHIANFFIPEHHPMKPACLGHLGSGLRTRFECLGEVTDVDGAITAQRDAARLTSDGDPHKPGRLSNLGTIFQSRFERLGNIADLDEGITAQQQAIRLTPDSDPDKPRCLYNLGISFESRFECLSDVADLDQAITAQQQAIRLTPDDHPVKPEHLNNLGISLHSRFKVLDNNANLDEAIAVQQHAVRLALDHPHKPRFLSNLGTLFQRRFERLGEVSDLGEAIIAQRQAIRHTPDGHPDKPRRLSNLGVSLESRFERLDDMTDLDEAIAVKQQAVRDIPDDHPDQPEFLNNLGNSFQSRFERLGDVASLDDAIAAQQRALRLTPDNQDDKFIFLSNLGNSFRYRFEHLGDIADLDKAITAQLQAVQLTPDGHPNKPEVLNNLGISSHSRFERLGDIANVNEAIMVQQQAIRLTPGDHPHKPKRLSNLGVSFNSRFERLGEIADLDEAITAQQHAVCLAPDDHPDKPAFLNNLGASFQGRFERLADIADLDKAIANQQQAVRLNPDGHPDEPAFLNNLGISFRSRFECLGDILDLDEAILAQQRAAGLTPDGHPEEPGRLSNLGISFHSRFHRLSNIADLNEAITAQQQAVRLTPDGHPDMPGRLSNLGISFQSRFEHVGGIADIEEAIKAHQQAVRLTPEGHHNKPGFLNNLGESFRVQHSRHPDDATLSQAIGTYSQSARSSFGPPSLRFAAARTWATLCFSTSSNETLGAYSTLIDLLPRIIWFGKTIEQRYKDILSVGGAVADAAAVAIHFGKFNLALEWLEQGRSIIWGQMLQLRTPLDNLRQHHPDEADELEKVSRALESAGMARVPSHSDNVTSQTLEEAAQVHRRLADGYDRIVNRIRSFPDFNDFLLPRKSTSLCRAATSGPVVIVNAHASRCDALILLPHSSQVYHVALPSLQMPAAREMQLRLAGLTRGIDAFNRDYAPYGEDGLEGLPPGTSIELSNILEQLWVHIVEPILRYLELLQESTTGDMPHITWCLTGPLTSLPIHAAGLYGAKDKPKIFDYAVSSYTPTLTALLSAKRPCTRGRGIRRLLAVSQPATPRQRWLPGTVHEVNAIQAIHVSTGRLAMTRLDDQEATVAAVLEGMKECDWIHLACHGAQDAASATDSAFILVDGRLTLKEIMKQSFSHTELAVLSACQTAKGDKELREEAIHLAAGMLMAGYGSVVATMWSIRDDDGPIIAEQFYKYIMDEAVGDSSRAAYALHDAVAYLRNTRGENEFASWVPYVHLGICSPLPPLPE